MLESRPFCRCFSGWFEKARAAIEPGTAQRAGLLGTQAIRGGANRNVLERIKQTGDIFWAWSDRKWLLKGAAVHVSMVGFDDGSETSHMLDGKEAPKIFANLSTGIDLTRAIRLVENEDICFMGTTKDGPFDIEPDVARKMLEAPLNPNGRPNSDVVRPWVNTRDLTSRPRGTSTAPSTKPSSPPMAGPWK